MKILFFAEAVTLAHVARPLALFAGLRDAGHACILACASSQAHRAAAQGMPFVPLESLPAGQFLAALAAGRPAYDAETLSRYVVDDLALIESVAPDLVIGDFRLSLSVSARVAGVPYASIANAYWSPFSALDFPLPVLPISRALPLPLAQVLFNLGRRWLMPAHCKPLNQLRRRFGLPSLGPDMRRVYTDADQVLYADAPSIFPMSVAHLPAGHHFLGPVLWSPQVKLPAWWSEPSNSRPQAYLNLGSSGGEGALGLALQALGGLDCRVLAAAAGAAVTEPLPANVRSATYLPGDKATERANLVVCNGGSMTCQQALLMGKPVLGIASNMDQFMNMSALVQAGAGICFRADRLTVTKLRQAAHSLLRDPTYAEAAARLGERMRLFNAGERLLALLPTLAARKTS